MKKRFFKMNIVFILVLAIICLLPVGHVFAMNSTESTAYSEPVIEETVTTENAQLVDSMTDEEEKALNAQYNETVSEVISEPDEEVFG